ncbi:MAG: phosphate ABC transporter permease subunit PstC [Chthoniobacterales bacterium]|nr:phosphate ABC transporter permease subunit PstC [Chthoniobacterales bacterium]
MAAPIAPARNPISVPVRTGPDYFLWLCRAASLAAIFFLGWIFWEIFRQAYPALKEFGAGFLSGAIWQPNRERYGVLPFLVGTVATSLIALLVALPPGLAIAIFLSEDFLPRPARQLVRFVVELLAAIPSVVYGLWGIFVVIPLIQKLGSWSAETFPQIPLLAGPAYGNSLLTASVVLALMILPTITAISRGSLVAVPRTLREGSYALGSTRWEAIFGVILPTAAPGIVAATILALGRAMGETMAVAMLIGNSSRLSWSLFAPSGTLASLLANQFGEAEGMQVSALMYAALVLVALTLAVNFAGEAVLRYTEKKTAGIL